MCLKEAGAVAKINYPVFRRAIEHVISDLDEFRFEDIKNRIASTYARLLVAGNHMNSGQASHHARAKVRKDVVGRIINQNIKTHRGLEKQLMMMVLNDRSQFLREWRKKNELGKVFKGKQPIRKLRIGKMP